MTTFAIDDFSGGRDRRPRLFYGKNKNLWHELTNAYIGKDRKVHRRWPLRFAAGTVTAFGAVNVDGVQTYFASKTFGGEASITGITSDVLQFDELPNHRAIALIDAKLYNGHVVALIQHQCAANSARFTYMLHVFDGLANKPTYVEDAYFPVSWGPTLPLHTYRTGTLGAYVAVVPRMGITAGKIYVSGPDGNTYFCSPNNARIWNTRTPAQITAEGEWFYWINYDAPALGLFDTTALVNLVPSWIVSEAYSNLALEATWSCYVLEYCDASGAWQKLVEDSPTGPSPSVHGHYQVVSVASRFAGGPNEIGFRIFTTFPLGPIFRFRLIAGPPPIVVTDGAVWSDPNTRSAGHITFEGSVVYAVSALADTPGVGDRIEFLSVAVPGTSAVDRPSAVSLDIPNGYATLTGYQRYHALILGWHFVGSSGGVDAFSYTAYAIYTGPGGTTKGHGFQAGNESAFYLDRQAYEASVAGFGVAGFLPTATQAKRDGGLVTAISVLKSFLAVHYRSMTLLYSVNSNQLLDVLKDTVAFGTGDHADGITVDFYNQSIIYSERGFRALSVGGFQSDRADDTNIGEANETFTTDDVLLGAAFWPYTGQYVALLQIDGVVSAYVFDYSRDSKISCWSRWPLPFTPAQVGTCTLTPVGSRLYIGYGTTGVAYYDAASATSEWFDDIDADGNVVAYEFESLAEGYYNQFGAPGLDKKFKAMDIIASGETTVEFKLISGGNERTIPGTVIEGTTVGGERVRLAMRANAVAVRFTATGRTEWILDAYSLDYDLIKR